MFLLQSLYIGSEWYMYKVYAICLLLANVGHCGRLTLFITITAKSNPYWI